MGWQYGDYIVPAADIPAGFCNAPTNLTRTVNGDTVTFRWDKPHDVLYYQIQITDTGNSTQQNINVYGTVYTRKLAALSSFSWKVIAVCSTDPSRQSVEASGQDFSTGAYTSTCSVIDVADCIVVSFPDRVNISWPAVPDASFYEVRYKPKDFFGEYSVITAQETFANIDFLLPNALYTWNVRPVCSQNTPAIPDHDGSFVTPVGEDECPTPKIRSITTTYGVITVIWDYEPLHKAYNIFLNNILQAQGFIGNIFMLSNLQADMQYKVDIVAVCEGGNSLTTSSTVKTAVSSCAKVFAVFGEYLVGQGLKISFVPHAAAHTYYVYVNGTRYQVDEDPAYVILDVPQDGTTYHIEVMALCGELGFIKGVSLPVGITYTVPFVCPPIEIVSVVPGPNNIFINWKNVPGVKNWLVAYKPVGQPDFIEEVASISQRNIKGLIPNQAYDIRITTTCQDDSTAAYVDVVSTSVLTACPLVVVQPVTKLTPTSATIDILVPGNPANGKYLAIIDDGSQTFEKEFYDNQLEVDGLIPGTSYTVVVENQCPDGSVSTSAPVGFTTIRTCKTVTNLSAVANYGTNNIDITWLNTGLTTQFALDVYRRMNGEINFVKIASGLTGTSFNYAFNPNDPLDISEIKVITRDTLTGLICEVATFIQCPPVIQLTSEVEANTVLLKWKPIVGVGGYRVKLTSLSQTGAEVYSTEAPSINITNLDPTTLYSWFVETVCTPGIEGPYSAVATFTTEQIAINDELCTIPQFTAVGEDSEFTNPDTGNPIKRVYYFTQANGDTPTELTSNVQTDPLGDITINFGPISGSAFFGIAYPESDNPGFKAKWVDVFDTNNAGNIGGVGDLFETRTAVINGITYKMMITSYDTTFTGAQKTLKFYTP